MLTVAIVSNRPKTVAYVINLFTLKTDLRHRFESMKWPQHHEGARARRRSCPYRACSAHKHGNTRNDTHRSLVDGRRATDGTPCPHDTRFVLTLMHTNRTAS